MENGFEEHNISERVQAGADGKYRWIYEMSLWKNPTFFVLIWKIFFFIIVGIFAFVMIFDIIDWGEFSAERALESLKMMGYFTIGITALVGISYMIYAAMMGGKYIVLFEMNEQGINHKQIPSQAKKAKKLGQATALVGLAAGKPSMVGAGIASQRTEMYTEFARVRKVKVYPRRQVIKVNQRLMHNQVYTLPEDFEFVKEFILARCPQAKH